NRRAAFAFIDRFLGLPRHDTLDAVRVLEPAALRCTPSGQVRVDLAGRSLTEIIREDFQALRARARSGGEGATIAERDRAAGYPGIRDWRVVADEPGPATQVIAWEAAGSATVGGVRIDRYRLRHSGQLVIPVLHV